MIFVIPIVILIMLVALAVYDLKFAEGRLGRAVKIVNLVFAVLITLAVSVWIITYMTYKSDSNKYLSHGAGLFGNISYDSTEGDYYIFKESRFLSAHRFAVPKSSVELPVMTWLEDYVIIYTDSDKSYPTKQLPFGEYEVWDDVVKISTDYTPLTLLIVIVAVGSLFAIDLLIFIIVICGPRSASTEEDDHI